MMDLAEPDTYTFAGGNGRRRVREFARPARVQCPRAFDKTPRFRDARRVSRRAMPAGAAPARRPAHAAPNEPGSNAARIRVAGGPRVRRRSRPRLPQARTRRRGFGRLVWSVRARRVKGRGWPGRVVLSPASGERVPCSSGRAASRTDPRTQRVDRAHMPVVGGRNDAGSPRPGGRRAGRSRSDRSRSVRNRSEVVVGCTAGTRRTAGGPAMSWFCQRPRFV
jgi:hypothetical protein